MVYKTKSSPEEKIKIVKSDLSAKTSHSEAERQAGVTSIVDWCRLFRGEGASAVLSRTRNDIYSSEVKRQAVTSYLAGEGSLETISERYGLRSYTQLQNWIKVYNSCGDFNSVKFSRGGSYMGKVCSMTQEERI